MILTGSDIVVQSLIDEGVDIVFGYPGGQVINLYDSLYKYQDKIRHILTCHEQGLQMDMQELLERWEYVLQPLDQVQQT